MILIFSSARAMRSANLPSGEVHLISAAALRTVGKSAKASINHLRLFMTRNGDRNGIDIKAGILSLRTFMSIIP